MSRTDVHTPYWVKVRTPGAQLREHHDHRAGTCTLEQFLADPDARWRGCTAELVYTGRNEHCGCNLCTGQTGRKYTRRQERTALRSARRRAEQEAAAGARADVAIDPGRVSSAWC